MFHYLRQALRMVCSPPLIKSVNCFHVSVHCIFGAQMTTEMATYLLIFSLPSLAGLEVSSINIVLALLAEDAGGFVTPQMVTGRKQSQADRAFVLKKKQKKYFCRTYQHQLCQRKTFIYNCRQQLIYIKTYCAILSWTPLLSPPFVLT